MRSIAAGVQAITHAGCFDQGAVKELLDAIGCGSPQVVTGTADALSFPGTCIINSPSADACTLAAPIPGAQPAGDDGKVCEIFVATGFAHTVTAPTNAINLNKHIITFTATAGNNVILQAWNGTWIVMGTEKGVSFS